MVLVGGCTAWSELCTWVQCILVGTLYIHMYMQLHVMQVHVHAVFCQVVVYATTVEMFVELMPPNFPKY